MGCIYKHTSKTTGKIYIGLTKYDNPECRWQNGNGYKNQGRFGAAIEKEGWDNFDHAVIEYNVSNNDLADREIYWIKYYDATNPNKGYNVSSGGGTGGSMHKTTKSGVQMLLELPPEIKKLSLYDIYKQFPNIKRKLDQELYQKYKGGNL